MKIDFIGVIHGHTIELEALLIDLGYNKINGFFSHPENRNVVFVGDFIDRGLQIRETLQIEKISKQATEMDAQSIKTICSENFV